LCGQSGDGDDGNVVFFVRIVGVVRAAERVETAGRDGGGVGVLGPCVEVMKLKDRRGWKVTR
jgi:hypothetical protein